MRSSRAVHLGSSPRVRGEVIFLLVMLRLSGIIPAGAGRRYPDDFAVLHLGDHPRGCGEKLQPRATMLAL